MAGSLPYTWTDVFATAPLAGNQLCVFHQADELPVETMSRLARELNHSETTFLQRPQTPLADARVRIFIAAPTGSREIPFAGHPVLGTAVVAAGLPAAETSLRLETGAGVLAVQIRPVGPDAWDAEMEQPLPRVVWSRPASSELVAALGLAPADLRSDLPVEAVDNGMQTVIVPLRDLGAARRLRPDLARLGDLLGRDGLCTLLFAPGGEDPGVDAHVRVFSPFDIVGEDPATGSANGPLGEYLVRHGVLPGPVVRIEQGIEVGRPSRLTVTVECSETGATRAVRVAGRVLAVGRGEFRLP